MLTALPFNEERFANLAIINCLASNGVYSKEENDMIYSNMSVLCLPTQLCNGFCMPILARLEDKLVI